MSLGETLNKAAGTAAAAGQWVSQHMPGQGGGTQTIHHWPNLMARLISKHSLWLTVCNGTGCSPTVPQINGLTWQMCEICGPSSDSVGEYNSFYFIDRGTESLEGMRGGSVWSPHLANVLIIYSLPKMVFLFLTVNQSSGGVGWHTCIIP